MTDNPFNNKSHNPTVLIPRPGSATVLPHGSPRAASQAHNPTPNIVTPSSNFKEFNQANAHSLSSVALTLLSLMANLQTTATHNNVPSLHKHITEEIKVFERNALTLGLPSATVMAARYLLCSSLDEIVLNTPWGSQSGWSQHSLLSLFHKETSGGEKSFLILDKMEQAPAQNIDILELFFHCFSLGFMGKYRFSHSGRAEIEQIQNNLYSSLRAHRPGFDVDLSPHWRANNDVKSSLTKYIPLWVIVCVGLALIVLSFSGFKYLLFASTTPLTENIQTQIKDLQPSLLPPDL